MAFCGDGVCKEECIVCLKTEGPCQTETYLISLLGTTWGQLDRQVRSLEQVRSMVAWKKNGSKYVAKILTQQTLS